MDTFFEQILPIKKTVKTTLAFVGIWVLALALSVFLFIYPVLATLSFLLIVGILYGAYRLSALLNIEYEYIITNGTMDIDKIINKSSRKRMLSFELGQVTRLEKYNPALLRNIDQKAIVFACNTDDENAYFLVAEKEGKGTCYLVFSPNEHIKSAAAKFIPKFIANSAFK